ncbi:hypothetical protein HZR84_02680 [Hyphobacterium sp. CCMP332]|nr:hypothetical protein HZR84_02680 [Hyphobacterium sp. CCMP332]
MIFKYTDYKKFLNEMKGLAPVKSFDEWEGEKCFLLRHDVDLSLLSALKLAEIEQSEGVNATFFILVSCRTYNCLSKPSVELIKKIHSLGHEIGLHFDPSIYPENNLEKEMKLEALILERIIDKKIQSISLHNPSVHNQWPEFKGYLNAYDKRIFSDDRYLSDSRMDFRGKNPFEFIKKVKDRPIQVLTHPMHYTESGENYDKIIPEYISEHMDFIEDYFVNEFKSQKYIDEVKPSLRYLVKKI